MAQFVPELVATHRGYSILRDEHADLFVRTPCGACAFGYDTPQMIEAIKLDIDQHADHFFRPIWKPKRLRRRRVAIPNYHASGVSP